MASLEMSSLTRLIDHDFLGVALSTAVAGATLISHLGYRNFVCKL